MKNRIRSIKDYLIYVAKHNKLGAIALIVDLIILICALYDYEDVIHKPTWIAILFAVFFTIIWQAINVISHLRIISKMNYTKDGGQLPIVNAAEGEEFKLSNGIRENYKPMEGFPHLYISEDIQAILKKENPIHITIKESKTREVKALIQSTWSTLAIFLNEKFHRTNTFYNEKKLCMTSEITKDEDKLKVYVCEGEYYNGYLTNEIYNFYLLEDSGTEFHSPYDASNYEIPLLGESIFSNHIGVSTLVLTKEKNEQRGVFLLVQEKKSSINPGKIVPTGSGSVDYDDMKGLDDLKQIIIRAAERELKEETKFDVGRCKGAKTTIIGFYRDMARGGKPEFCCVTEVPLEHNAITIEPQPVEQIPTKKDFCEFSAETGELKNITLRFKKSNTLEANLYFLKKYLKEK